MSADTTSFLFLRLPLGALRGLAQTLALSFGLFVCALTYAAAQDAPQSEGATGEQTAPETPSPEDSGSERPSDEMNLGIQEEAEPAGSETSPASWDVSSPCENVQHPYEADLCQQWRTAEAAEETAQATMRSLSLSRLLMLIGLVATALLFLMFVPVLMAAFAARRAARAGSGAASRAGAPDQGRKENEVRAYVDVDDLEFIETPESDGIVKVKLNFRNSGQTPALKLRSVAEVGIRDISDEDLLPVMPLPEPSSFDPARPRLGRDATATEIVSCESPPKLADRVTNGDATILVWGLVEYTDVFDRKRKTTFQYLCNDETLDTGQIFKPMVRGDEDG